MNEQEFQDSLGDLLNQRWGKLLGSALIEIERLKFNLSQQDAQIQQMTENEILNIETIDNLRQKLHQAECDVLAARAKSTIDEG